MRSALSLTALLLAGCSLAPRYERGAAPVPPAWPTGNAYAGDYANLPSASYRDLFRDDGLQKLIALALENNRDVRQAAANIERARAQFRIQRAELFPQLDANAGLTRGSAVSSAPATTSTSASLSIPSYEIDLFGRIRSLTDAARNSYFASQSDAQAVKLALIGDIATAWLTYAADKSRLDLSAATIVTAQKTVDLTQARLSGGVAPRTDLRQAQTILATAQSDLARYTTAIAQDRNLIELLVGAPIDPALLPSSIETANERIAAPASGMSSEVLLRRPDVMAAEYNLRAANAQIGAARAALFPRLTLGGLIGLIGPSLEGLFGNAGQDVSQGTASATYPIFQAGAGRANVAASKAQRDAVLAAYEKAIQTAYREVADALARQGTMTDQINADRLRTTAAQDAYTLSDARYRGGVDSFLQALDAQRSAYAAQNTLVATLLTAATNRVTLYRALGGEAAGEPAGAN
ncbi:efflux transporter outer membrane subunit [Sphingobium sp. H33]|uniref:Efflux transporter outer membrane subunit n=2 Tax=Sphingobium nicotianae TaxID=2782607 RepID=A0A9X1DFA9_9SPHN|nr:efflux transporter outer membrane subunit [Sphingobium nicotianae]MBT2188872.1 efflux transporter outer membrane subunit [Sphingobium nicotianae]